jgi:hypothetical protein
MNEHRGAPPAKTAAGLIVTVSLEIEVSEPAWSRMAGVGDAYDCAAAQRRRSLVADVEDYVQQALAESAAAAEGAIMSVDLVVPEPSS